MERELNVRVLGEGDSMVVFCHGLFGRGKNWAGIAAQLGEPSLLIDLPNHGESYWTADFSYLDMADAVAATIRRRVPAGAHTTLVGHSMGGKVAMMLALGHPGLISRLAVVDITPAGSAVGTGFRPLVAAMRGLDLGALTSRGDADRALAQQIPDAGVRQFLLQNLRHHKRSWRWQMNLDLLGDELDQIGSWPDLGLPSYPGPCMWIKGADSPYITPDDLPVMRELFPAVRLVTVKNAGHWVHADQPEVVVAALRALLAQPV